MLLEDGAEKPGKPRLDLLPPHAVDHGHAALFGADQPALPENSVVVGDSGGRHSATGLRAILLAFLHQPGDDGPPDGIGQRVEKPVEADLLRVRMVQGANHAA